MDKFNYNNNNNNDNNYNQDYNQSYNSGQQWNVPPINKNNELESKPSKNKVIITTALGTLAAVALAGSIYAMSTIGSDDKEPSSVSKIDSDNNQKANSDKEYKGGLTIDMIKKELE